jgi:RsiW-degrading membrane proteinase PrsW (M82 family)
VCFVRGLHPQVSWLRLSENFAMGFIGALPVLLFEIGFSMLFALIIKASKADAITAFCISQFLMAFAVAGFIEETLKYFVIAFYPAFSGIRHVYGIVILSVAGSLGYFFVVLMRFIKCDVICLALIR